VRELVVSSCVRMSYKRHNTAGFSLIELVVVIGVIMVLVGLSLPMVGRAMAQVRSTRDLANIRSCATSIQMYCDQSKGYFPNLGGNAQRSALWWTNAMVRAGVFQSDGEGDPDGVEKFGEIRVRMSMCMCYSIEGMTPGQTVPLDVAVAEGVRSEQVSYPSRKGLAHQQYIERDVHGTYWCCACLGPCAPFAGAFVDGSAQIARVSSYINGDPIVRTDGIGVPLFSSWGGYKAIDR